MYFAPSIFEDFRMVCPYNGSAPPLPPLRSIFQNQGKTQVLPVLPPMAHLVITMGHHTLVVFVIVIQISNCPKALIFVIYYADYGAERCFSHFIQVFILIYFYRYCKCNPKECHDKELCKTDNDCGEDGKCKWQMVADKFNSNYQK